MVGDYICNYLHNSGEVCGRGCRRPEGCFDHYKSKKCYPCIVCSKPTGSDIGLCKKDAKAYYVIKSLYGSDYAQTYINDLYQKIYTKKI